MKRLFVLMVTAVMACCMFSACEKDVVTDSMDESLLYGTWCQDHSTLIISNDGTWTAEIFESSQSHFVTTSGTWTFDADAKVWWQHYDFGSDTIHYENDIIKLDETSLSYMDQFGDVYNWQRAE